MRFPVLKLDLPRVFQHFAQRLNQLWFFSCQLLPASGTPFALRERPLQHYFAQFPQLHVPILRLGYFTYRDSPQFSRLRPQKLFKDVVPGLVIIAACWREVITTTTLTSLSLSLSFSQRLLPHAIRIVPCRSAPWQKLRKLSLFLFEKAQDLWTCGDRETERD